MVKITIEYTGGLHCDAVHGPSQAKIETDAPADNQGKGEAFSPTDLVGTALGTCIATTMAIVAERHQVELTGMTSPNDRGARAPSGQSSAACLA